MSKLSLSFIEGLVSAKTVTATYKRFASEVRKRNLRVTNSPLRGIEVTDGIDRVAEIDANEIPELLKILNLKIKDCPVDDSNAALKVDRGKFILQSATLTMAGDEMIQLILNWNALVLGGS